ncbi:MAG: CoA transferase, partial [Candidatus Limnocylindria bacterium]
YQPFTARDGQLVVAVGNDAQFGRLLDVLGLEDADERYATNQRRVAARAELTSWLGAAMASWDRGALVDALAAADVPAGPVNSVSEALAAMGDEWTQSIDGIKLPPTPFRLDGERPVVHLPPPLLGQHTDAILDGLGR